MGFDWESMLDAEGANLDLAYSDLVANALELPADYMSSISDYEDNQEEESPAVDTSLPKRTQDFRTLLKRWTSCICLVMIDVN